MAPLEIVRGDFVYRDIFFADLGQGRRHARASPSELEEFLLPDPDNQYEDQVGHLYEAQLLHYGLPPSKNKQVAKLRLMQALSTGRLQVPPVISAMETSMRNEWLAAVERDKARSSKVKLTPTSRAKRTPQTQQENRFNIADYRLNNYDLDAADDANSTDDPPPYSMHDPPHNRSTTSYSNNHHFPESRFNPHPPSPNTITNTTTTTTTTNPRTQISGTYDIHATVPSLNLHFPTETNYLSLRLDKTTQPISLWGILLISDHIRCVFTTTASSNNNANNNTAPFPTSALHGSKATVYWRAEDLHTGEAIFRWECAGQVAFDGMGRMDLVLWGLLRGDSVLVDGELLGRGGESQGEGWGLERIRAEWFAIADRAYGRGGY